MGLDFACLPTGGAAAQFVAFGEVGAVLLVFGVCPVPNGGAAHAVNSGYVFYCDELLLHKKTPLLFVEHGVHSARGRKQKKYPVSVRGMVFSGKVQAAIKYPASLQYLIYPIHSINLF